MPELAHTAQLLERLARLIQNDAHRDGLKPAQWEALRYLARANRFSRSPSALTAFLGTTKGTVSQTLNALERKGLIEKRSDPVDRRQVRLDLAPAGQAVLERDPVSELLAALDGLSLREQAALGRGLEVLLAGTLARRGRRPFGLCRLCRHFRPGEGPDPEGGFPHFCGLLEEKLSIADSARICQEQEAEGVPAS